MHIDDEEEEEWWDYEVPYWYPHWCHLKTKHSIVAPMVERRAVNTRRVGSNPSNRAR